MCRCRSCRTPTCSSRHRRIRSSPVPRADSESTGDVPASVRCLDLRSRDPQRLPQSPRPTRCCSKTTRSRRASNNKAATARESAVSGCWAQASRRDAEALRTPASSPPRADRRSPAPTPRANETCWSAPTRHRSLVSGPLPDRTSSDRERTAPQRAGRVLLSIVDRPRSRYASRDPFRSSRGRRILQTFRSQGCNDTRTPCSRRWPRKQACSSASPRCLARGRHRDERHRPHASPPARERRRSILRLRSVERRSLRSSRRASTDLLAVIHGRESLRARTLRSRRRERGPSDERQKKSRQQSVLVGCSRDVCQRMRRAAIRSRSRIARPTHAIRARRETAHPPLHHRRSVRSAFVVCGRGGSSGRARLRASLVTSILQTSGFALEVAEVVQLRATHDAARDELDLVDPR
jgi:hypothetical protein